MVKTKNGNLCGYDIHKDYHKVTIYQFGKKYGALLSTEVFEPDKKRPRKERYERICEVMAELGFYVPVYRTAKR